jgi:predicted NAD/FAD-dependent oxidoreductase
MDDGVLEHAVRSQLEGWFGGAVRGWRLIETVRVPRALPRALPVDLDPATREHGLGAGLALAGDYLTDNSINGAMRSGRVAAAHILGGAGSGSASRRAD